MDFPKESLLENVNSLVDALLQARPQKLKGSGASGYLLRMYLSSTMGPSIPVVVQSAVSGRRA